MAFEKNIIRFDYDFYYKYGAIELALAPASLLVFPKYMMGNSIFAYALACYVGAVGLNNILAGVRHSLQLKRLHKPHNFTIPAEQVKDEAYPDEVYIGEGFPWTVAHARLYQQIMSEEKNQKVMNRTAAATEVIAGEDGKKRKKIKGGLHFLHRLGVEDEHSLRFELAKHTMIAGTTGSGKTRLCELISLQKIRLGECVIVIDPKGDKRLYNSVYNACLSCGRENDFEYFSLTHPQSSASMNLIQDYTSTTDIAARLYSILPREGSSASFASFCYDVLSNVADVMDLCQIEITLKNLNKYAVLDREGLEAEAYSYLKDQSIHMSKENEKLLVEALEQFAAITSHDSDHFKKMIVNLKPTLRPLVHGEVGNLLSPKSNKDALTWGKIFKKKKVIYINLGSMIDGFRASTVGKLLVQDMISYVGRVYSLHRDEESTPGVVFVDEFFSVAYEGYIEMLNKARGAGVNLVLLMQTAADIDTILGPSERKQIMGNMENKIFLRVPDEDLAEEQTKPFGTVYIDKIIEQRGLSSSPASDETMFNSTYGIRKDRMEVPLLPPKTITHLPLGHGIITTEGIEPHKFCFPLVEHENEMNHMDEVIIGDSGDINYTPTSVTDQLEAVDSKHRKML